MTNTKSTSGVWWTQEALEDRGCKSCKLGMWENHCCQLVLVSVSQREGWALKDFITPAISVSSSTTSPILQPKLGQPTMPLFTQMTKDCHTTRTVEHNVKPWVQWPDPVPQSSISQIPWCSDYVLFMTSSLHLKSRWDPGMAINWPAARKLGEYL